uniref:Nucleolar protein n=1 Tax=Lotharella vacuolata TaxID=74820 RepID=A0A0H5BH85_9EUKA|nr:nucleolar protein [Lotharella vacuolata]
MFLIIEDILGIFLFKIYKVKNQTKIKNLISLKFTNINFIEIFTNIYVKEYFNIKTIFEKFLQLKKNTVHQININLEKNKKKIINFIKIKRFVTHTLEKYIKLDNIKTNHLISLRIVKKILENKILLYPKIDDNHLIYNYAFLLNIENQITSLFEKLKELRLIPNNKIENHNLNPLFEFLKVYKNEKFFIEKYNSNKNSFFNTNLHMHYFLNFSKSTKIWKYLLKILKMYKTIKSNLFKKIILYTPNLASLLGERISAQLVFKTHGLINLVKLPSGSISNLSFDFFNIFYRKKIINSKNKIINYSFLVSQGSIKNRFKIIRILSNKSSLCCRIDFFSLQSINYNYGFNFRGMVF